MAKYQQYESVLLKDGRIATIVEVYEPGAYDADIGDSPEDWATVYGITDDEIDGRNWLPGRNTASARITGIRMTDATNVAGFLISYIVFFCIG